MPRFEDRKPGGGAKPEEELELGPGLEGAQSQFQIINPAIDSTNAATEESFRDSPDSCSIAKRQGVPLPWLTGSSSWDLSRLV